MARHLDRTGIAVVGLAATFLAGCAALTPMSGQDRYLSDFQAAQRSGRTFSPATEVLPNLTLPEAYALQRRLVASEERSGNVVIGFKGGLMSAKSLADRGVTEPLVGSLFISGDLSSGAEVSLCGYRRAAFELKLGYIFRSPVTEKVATVDDLAALVDSVQPIAELPDIAYRDDKTYNAVDMAAANISSARFVRGTARPLGTIDLDNLRVSLSRDATRVASGTGRDSLGSQWESLRTVVNLVIANGGRIAPGEIVITGKIGAKGDLLPGYYSADYDALGALNFTVSKCASRPG